MKKFVVKTEGTYGNKEEFEFNSLETAQKFFKQEIQKFFEGYFKEKYNRSEVVKCEQNEFLVVYETEERDYEYEGDNCAYKQWTIEEKTEENKEEEFTMVKKMKIEVTQVPPEAQESYWMIDGEPDNIILFGNRDYSEHWGKWGDISRDYENCIDSFNEDFTSKGEPIEEGFFSSIEELTEYYLNPYGYKYKEEDEKAWLALFLDDICYKKEAWVPVVLSLIERKAYRCSVLRGICQSDWQYVVFSSEDYPSKDAVRGMESEYFNTGSEWHVELFEEENLIDSFNFYSEEYLDSKEEIIQAVREQIGYIANAAYDISVCAGYRTEPVFETL